MSKRVFSASRTATLNLGAPAKAGIALAFVLAAFTASAQAGSVFIDSTGIGYGANAGYGIVSAGPNASLTINSGPIIGNVLVGDGSSVSTSGGGNGGITGTINYDSNTFSLGQIKTDFSGLQTKPSAGQFVEVPLTSVQQAVADAATLSSIASGLTADVTVANINSSPTVYNASGAGADGVFVVDVGNISNADIVLNGTSGSVFVFNVSGKYSTNQSLTLQGGILPSNVLFNFTGTSGNVFQTSGGNVSVGTYLATQGGNFQFSNLDLSGTLINTGAHTQFVSGSSMFSVVLPPVPLPAAAWTGLSLMGVLGLASGLRRRKAAE